MPVWKTRTVDEEPVIRLQRWRILRTDVGSEHFVGFHRDGWSGRVSSDIEQLHPAARRGVTSTGRIYVLDGPSAWHTQAEYVWKRWCLVNHILEYQDVTLALIPDAESDQH